MAERGRNNLWEEMNMINKLDAVKGWALQGYNDKEIMAQLVISKSTFYKWKDNHKEFKEVLDTNRHVAIAELVTSAKEMAQGYYVDEIKTTVDGMGEVTVETKKKYITPDGGMNRFLLRNWDAEQFKDEKTINHEINRLEDYITEEETITFEDDEDDEEEE